MWGNTTGWIIAAVIGLGMGSLLLMVALPPTPTAPTNAPVFGVANKSISLPVPSNTVVAEGTQDADAGALYQKAIADYQKKTATYGKFLHGGAMTIKPAQLTAIDFILKARDCKNCNLFSRDPAKIVNYDNTEPPLEALSNLGTVCCNLGKLYTLDTYAKPTKPDQAVKLWEAAFIMGRHLYEERVSWAELGEGHGLMQTAAINLQNLYRTKKDQTRVDTIQNFLDEENTYQKKLTEAFKIIGGIDETYAGPYAGDIFKVATNTSADPMFRVEALKHVGHYRYNAKTMGDQRLVRKVLKKMSDEPNLPASVKEAVKAAQDLTIEQHNMVGGSA